MTETYGWVGKILKVDLTSGKTTDEDTMKYTKDFIGGRGINARIAWDEIPPETGPFDPENRILIMTGPLTGSAIPGLGKIELNTFGPQVYPKEYYTPSSMGGGWGAELKFAGYDGVIVQGRSEKPVYVWVNDGEVEIKSAERLWGIDIFSTQQLLVKEHGSGTQAIAIGQAGENLVRYAIIATETESAAGQGGFGAVMGSKKLKAIAVKGTGSIKVADIDKFLEVRQRVMDQQSARASSQTTAKLLPLRDPNVKRKVLEQWTRHLGQIGLKDYEWKYTSCPGCGAHCQAKMILNVPGKLYPSLNTADIHCVERRWLVPGWNIPPKASREGSVYGLYKSSHVGLPKTTPEIKDYESSFEAKIMGDKYGINMWEFTLGIISWLTLCEEHGLITDEDIDIPFARDRGEFWSMLLRKIALREGIGDVLAEGVPRAADILKKGREYVPNLAHGSCPQGIGRGIQSGAAKFPRWLISALLWVTATRDPMPSTRIRVPISGPPYEGIAEPVIIGQNRAMVQASIVNCGRALSNPATQTMLLSAVTGITISEEELDNVGERIFNLERAIMVRQGRTREYDVGCGVIEYLKERPDTDGIRLDEKKFLKLLDEYYEGRKWDVKTGIPTKEKLRELNLAYVADDLKKRGLIS
jgi:aldehyde:ferredoxin oxidoreductase